MGLFKALHKILSGSDNNVDKDPVNESIAQTEEALGKSVIEELKDEGKLDEDSLSKNPSGEEVIRYINSYGDRVVLSNQQNEHLRKEYSQVTDYLTDIQVIDSIEGNDAKKINEDAAEIIKLEQEKLHCKKRDNKINEKQYKLMEQYSDIINQELINMKKREKYQLEIKSDMRYLEGEKAALKYEQNEMLVKQKTMRSISISTGVLVFSVFAFLAVIWVYSGYDMTIPFITAVAFGGLTALLIILGMRKAIGNMIAADRKLNKAVVLLNGVKIKYINNTALLDYMCGKYNVRNSVELEYIWNNYLKAKADEETLSANAKESKEHKDSLEEMLRAYDVKDTEVWTFQAQALLDSREMVEVRHKLNVRRQKLREQIAYNDELIRKSSYVLWKLIKSKPQYKTAISDMLKSKSIEQVVVTSLRR